MAWAEVATAKAKATATNLIIVISTSEEDTLVRANYHELAINGDAARGSYRLHKDGAALQIHRNLLCSNDIERRGWDSNPRYGYPYNGFPIDPGS